MDKQNSSKNEKGVSTKEETIDTKLMPKVSIFSKPNFFKQNQNIQKSPNKLTPKFKETDLPKTSVKFTQHKGGS